MCIKNNEKRGLFFVCLCVRFYYMCYYCAFFRSIGNFLFFVYYWKKILGFIYKENIFSL